MKTYPEGLSETDDYQQLTLISNDDWVMFSHEVAACTGIVASISGACLRLVSGSRLLTGLV